MPAATLCELCQSIPFLDLPHFPDDSYTRTATGKEHLQELIHHKLDDPIPEPLGFHHHPKLESLRRASAAGCELCRQIEIQADRLLEDIAERKARWVEYPSVATPTGDPSFDLWVTRRGEGGDGFWVSAKSVSKPDKLLFVVATFGFCAEDDDPLALAFSGRPITGPPDDNTLDRVASWVKTCDSHQNCLGRESLLPTRLIDVGGPGPENIVRVVETNSGTKGVYTALSYCWGTVTNTYITTLYLLKFSRNGMDLASLPRTFRDAISMTRRLGVRYIWVDSLCICQDDMKDWERESARMASIYSNAYLTIAATGSPDASHGLFFDRPKRPYLRISPKQTTTNDTGGDILIFPLGKSKEVNRSYRVDMVQEPLAARGWAFQERLLSTRILHFARDQISFECLEGTVMEDGLRMPYRYFYAHPGKDAEERTMIGEQSYGEEEAKPDRDRRADILLWYSLLIAYSDLKLTFPSDKLPALSGVANIYADLLDDEYVAGIWRKTLIEGLCWKSFRCKPVNRYRAPSWSWASVEGKVATGDFGRRRELGTVLDYHVDIDGDNPFGRVKDAWLKIRAPLVPLSLSEQIGPTGFMCLKTRHGDPTGSVNGFDTIDRNYSVSANLVRTMTLYALVLAVIYKGEGGVEVDSDDGDICVYSCLILTPAGDGEEQISPPGTLKRVGWIHYGPEDLDPDELDSSMRTVVLV